MSTILEYYKQQEFLNIDGPIKELVENLVETTKDTVKNGTDIKQICADLFETVLDVRLKIALWLKENGNIANESWEWNYYNANSKKFPKLVIDISVYSSLVTRVDPNFDKDALSQKNNHENYDAEFLPLHLTSSIYFELCLIIADLIIEGEVVKSDDWVEDFENFLRTTFVIYLAGSMVLELIEFEEKDFIKNPILNRAKIIKSEFGVFGSERIQKLIA